MLSQTGVVQSNSCWNKCPAVALLALLMQHSVTKGAAQVSHRLMKVVEVVVHGQHPGTSDQLVESLPVPLWATAAPVNHCIHSHKKSLAVTCTLQRTLIGWRRVWSFLFSVAWPIQLTVEMNTHIFVLLQYLCANSGCSPGQCEDTSCWSWSSSALTYWGWCADSSVHTSQQSWWWPLCTPDRSPEIPTQQWLHHQRTALICEIVRQFQLFFHS